MTLLAWNNARKNAVWFLNVVSWLKRLKAHWRNGWLPFLATARHGHCVLHTATAEVWMSPAGGTALGGCRTFWIQGVAGTLDNASRARGLQCAQFLPAGVVCSSPASLRTELLHPPAIATSYREFLHAFPTMHHTLSNHKRKPSSLKLPLLLFYHSDKKSGYWFW